MEIPSSISIPPSGLIFPRTIPGTPQVHEWIGRDRCIKAVLRRAACLQRRWRVSPLSRVGLEDSVRLHVVWRPLPRTLWQKTLQARSFRDRKCMTSCVSLWSLPAVYRGRGRKRTVVNRKRAPVDAVSPHCFTRGLYSAESTKPGDAHKVLFIHSITQISYYYVCKLLLLLLLFDRKYDGNEGKALFWLKREALFH